MAGAPQEDNIEAVKCREKLKHHAPSRRRAFAITAAVVAAAALPAAAHADSLVFTKGDQIWISHVDGSAARPVTRRPNHWAWPSMADDGTIFAAGGDARVNPDGSDSGGSSEIYHLDQAGNQIGPFVETPGSRSTPALPTDSPDNLRVSPNGKLVSYDLEFNDNRDSFWEDLSNAHFNLVSEDYNTSVWLDDGHFVITHNGDTFGNAAYAVYDIAQPDSSHGPSDDPYLPDYKAVATRDGSRVAVYEADPLISGQGVASADIQLFAPAGNDIYNPGTMKCKITLNAATATTSLRASLSFTRDGSKLAWAGTDGVHESSTANLDTCSSVGDQLLLRGAAAPFFGPADEQPTPPQGHVALHSTAKSAKLSAKGALTFSISASESGTASVTGTITVPKHAHAVRFAGRNVRLAAGKPTKVTLRLSKTNAAAVRRALTRKNKLTAHITVSAKAASGDTGTVELALRLRP